MYDLDNLTYKTLIKDNGLKIWEKTFEFPRRERVFISIFFIIYIFYILLLLLLLSKELLLLLLLLLLCYIT